MVEVDESKFGKQKYNRVHRVKINCIFLLTSFIRNVFYVKGESVFGGIERGSRKCFFEVVENRSRETLLPIIKNNINECTTIISDLWKAYDCLDHQEQKQ